MPGLPNINDLNFSLQQADINSKTDKGTAKLLELLNPQNKNKFEMLVYPASSRGVLSASTYLDEKIYKFYVQTLDIPFLTITYEMANEKKYIKELTYPENITLTFFEDEGGTVRKYIKSLMDDIAVWDYDRQSWMFRDDQLAAKKNAKILLQNGVTGITEGWVDIRGMKFSNQSNLTLGQDDNEYLKFDLIFAIDYISWEIFF